MKRGDYGKSFKLKRNKKLRKGLNLLTYSSISSGFLYRYGRRMFSSDNANVVIYRETRRKERKKERTICLYYEAMDLLKGLPPDVDELGVWQNVLFRKTSPTIDEFVKGLFSIQKNFTRDEVISKSPRFCFCKTYHSDFFFYLQTYLCFMLILLLSDTHPLSTSCLQCIFCPNLSSGFFALIIATCHFPLQKCTSFCFISTTLSYLLICFALCHCSSWSHFPSLSVHFDLSIPLSFCTIVVTPKPKKTQNSLLNWLKTI